MWRYFRDRTWWGEHWKGQVAFFIVLVAIVGSAIWAAAAVTR
jgi:hypothetical protein